MLHALLDYAKHEQLLAEPGFKPKIVRWLLVFSGDGKFLGVQDLRGEEKGSRGREFRACPDLTQQEMVAAGAGCRHFLVDGVDVVALLTKDGEVDDKLAAKHEFFVDLLCQASRAVGSLGPLATALADEKTVNAVREQLSERRAKPTELATFALLDSAGDGVSTLVDESHWHEWWRDFRRQLTEQRKAKGPAKRAGSANQGEDGARRMRCLLSGQLVEPQPTHNKITGLSDVGGLAMGDALTSFDKAAFASYGLQQGANAAMSETIVKTYTTALNDLLRRRSYRLAGVKIVYWYSHRIAEDDDVFAEALQGFGNAPADDEHDRPAEVDSARDRSRAESRAKRLLDAIRSGQRPDLAGLQYYALSLSGNSGRVVVRDWMEGSFESLAEAIDAWFGDLAIVRRDGRDVVNSHKFAAVLAAPLRDLKDAAPPLVASMWRCAMKRQPVPHQVMAQTLNRVRVDIIQNEAARHARIGLLKAFCNRNGGTPKMNASLNDHETNSAYLCGRILAILAKIQQTAMPDVGVGVVQRYYAAASATPGLVLGRLVRTAQVAHLPKIDSGGLRQWFENQLSDIWRRLQTAPPRVLTLEEQTLFAMGYYHQMAQRSKKASDSPAAEDPAAEA